MGVIVGKLRKPRRKLAFWLGAITCLIEIAGVALVWFSFRDAQSRLGDYADGYRPGSMFRTDPALTLSAGIVALLTAVPAEQTPIRKMSEEAASGH